MEGSEKSKATRTPRPVYAVMQIMDGEGKPVAIRKEQVNIISAHKDAEVVLDIMDSGQYPSAIYKKIPLDQ
tara:strand:+ start:813 stop:1025 length:213 start_codon:yes stop_codon:yes gene_type:complete